MAKEEQEHDFLIADIVRATKRASGAKYLEAATEFAREAYPLMQAMADHFGDRMTRMEEAMDAMMEQTDSFLQPELARQIMATLELGKIVATLAAKLPGKDLQQAAAAYLTAFEMTLEAVEDATLPPNAAAGEDDEEEGEDEEDEPQVAAATPEAPAAEVE